MPAPHLIGASAALRRVRALCHKVAATDMTVLLCGETGSGKEVAAREIHAASPRRAKPFIAVNCAALSEHLVESELFGHEKGAFTGATGQKPGRFELADGGTLFLDEIGEMPAPLQAKLLRAVEERACVRVGGTRPVSFDVRLIAATNRDLKREAEAGRFRQDLYYRLSVFPIELPPLRLRVEDVRPLAEHFLGRIAPSLGAAAAAGPPGVSEAAVTCLTAYHWPGNIRELRNVIERGALLAGGQPIAPEHLPPEIAAAAASAATAPPGAGAAGGSRLEDQERSLLVEALEQSGWNQSAAARRLRITRDCCRSRMKKYGLSISGGEPPTSAG
jgi:transcriptional regulator with GAF, ATPase, and Fis domain